MNTTHREPRLVFIDSDIRSRKQRRGVFRQLTVTGEQLHLEVSNSSKFLSLLRGWLGTKYGDIRSPASADPSAPWRLFLFVRFLFPLSTLNSPITTVFALSGTPSPPSGPPGPVQTSSSCIVAPAYGPNLLPNGSSTSTTALVPCAIWVDVVATHCCALA